MNFQEALSYLISLGHETLTIKLGLKNTEILLEALGNPHEAFPAVQIAGTNGKGSTAVMLGSICRTAGLRTGLFTSPHLISITERIKINGEHLSEQEFARFTDEVRTTAERLVEAGKLDTLPTFFEHVTAIALLAFREAKVELAILETGLGGRLDSTTAAQADVVALTPIAIDHEEYLGQTLAQIASEKAAIIRPGLSVVVAPQPAEAGEIVLRRCEEVGVLPRLVNHAQFIQAMSDGRCRVTFETPYDIYENVLIGLRGRHQVDNASVAVALAETLHGRGFEIPREAIIRGFESANHPGRLELWPGEPPILFDGAHNPAAALALRSYLDEFVTQPITMLFGAMRDKRLAEMATILFPKARDLILTEFDNPRAASIAKLKTAVSTDSKPARLHHTNSIRAALRLAESITRRRSNGLILITGSLYLVGAAQEALRRQSVATSTTAN